jgi:hypothetical protein
MFFAQEASSEPDWSDRDAVIDYIVEGERPFAGLSWFKNRYVAKAMDAFPCYLRLYFNCYIIG